MNYTNASHIRKLIESKVLDLLPIQMSSDFKVFIESLPRVPPLANTIDWSQMGAHEALDWYATPDKELIDWAKSMAIGRHEFVATWFASGEPSVASEFSFGVANMDVLIRHAPGTRYLFGLDKVQGRYYPHFGDFIEFGAGSTITAVKVDSNK